MRGVDARLFERLALVLRVGRDSGIALMVINSSSLAKVACAGWNKCLGASDRRGRCGWVGVCVSNAISLYWVFWKEGTSCVCDDGWSCELELSWLLSCIAFVFVQCALSGRMFLFLSLFCIFVVVVGVGVEVVFVRPTLFVVSFESRRVYLSLLIIIIIICTLSSYWLRWAERLLGKLLCLPLRLFFMLRTLLNEERSRQMLILGNLGAGKVGAISCCNAYASESVSSMDGSLKPMEFMECAHCLAYAYMGGSTV